MHEEMGLLYFCYSRSSHKTAIPTLLQISIILIADIAHRRHEDRILVQHDGSSQASQMKQLANLSPVRIVDSGQWQVWVIVARVDIAHLPAGVN